MKKWFILNSFRTLLLVALIAIGAMRANAQVSVTATAGTLGPTAYARLTQAVNAINAGTHQGVITITVTGSYTETVLGTLNQSGSGASSYTAITIKPAPATNPVITANIGTGILFIKGSNVTIDGSNTVGGTTRNLTFNNTNAASAYVIRLGSPTAALGATNNTIKNCILTNASTSGTGDVIMSGSGVTAYAAAEAPNSNNTIQNNAISGAQVGVGIVGPPATDNAWNISGNTFTNLGFNGILLYYASNLTISNNNISGVSINAGTGVAGILLSWTINGGTISNNVINTISCTYAFSSPGAEGIYIDITSTAANLNIFNNFIANITAASNPAIGDNGIGIYVDGGGGINVFDNSVNQSPAANPTIVGANPLAGAYTADISFDPFAFGTIPDNSINVVDNIFANTETVGTSYDIVSFAASTVYTNINYNDYFSTSYLGYLGVNCANMLDMQTNFGGNTNSIILNPVWTSSTDLHLTTAASNAGLVVGTTIAGLTTDIDGDARPNPTTIGADEIINNTITYTALTSTCSNGDITLSPVTIISGVGVPTTGTTMPRIYFRKNAGAWFSNAGTLSSGTGTSGQWSFTITAATVGGVVGGDIISYYVIAQTTGGTVFANPSAGLVATNVNTVTTAPTTPNTYTVNAVAMTGLVTTASVCSSAAAQNATFAYTGITGTPNQYTLTWAPAGPTNVAAFTALPASPITVAIPGGTAANTYTGTLTIKNSTTGCTNTYTLTLTINPTPAAITGTFSMCNGASVVLSSTTGGGVWSSVAGTGTATVSGTSGTATVTGTGVGTATISYTLGSCSVSQVVTVNTQPAAITGTLTLCNTFTTVLADATAGGAWTSVAGTGSASVVTGTVTGITVGTATISYTIGTCASTAVVTINTQPAAITGTASVCNGASTNLADATAGGAWTSVAGTGSATITGTAGASTVTGTGVGTVTISYTIGSCAATRIVTVNAQPAAITGTLAICNFTTTTLSDATAGGAWTSVAGTGAATISGTGGTAAVSGTLVGTVTISYTIGTCAATAVLTINTQPAGITGTLTVCNGLTTTLADATPTGSWSVVPGTGTATISGVGVVQGTSPGTVTISYTIGTCAATTTVTVSAQPGIITGTTNVCNGFTTTLSNTSAGGLWTTTAGTGSVTVSTAGVITGTSVGTATVSYTTTGCTPVTTVITINPAQPITGTLSICNGSGTTLSDAIASGAWASGNTAVATIGTSGIVTSVSAGTSDISYILPSGCIVTATLTVNPIPAPITGTLTVCVGSTTTLADITPGGTWASGNTGIATIGTSSGVVTGQGAGAVLITYSAAGCPRTATLLVNGLPAAIGGPSVVCVNSTITLTDASGGGAWTSSTPGIASVSGPVVTGASSGTATITYTLPTTCYVTKTVTVNPIPALIAGTPDVCVGFTTLLTDSDPGGTWWSSNTAVATVGSASGSVSGVSGGVSIISYVFVTTGCYRLTLMNVHTPPTAITGPSVVCAGDVITLAEAVPGGTWSSSAPSTATVGSTGIVTGIALGAINISYSIYTCPSAIHPVTVNPLPAPITGIGSLCVGHTATFSDASPGGTWSSSSSTATISPSGVVTGVSYGPTANITYTLPTGCYRSVPVIVDSLPGLIMGTDSVCKGSSVTLTDATAGGIWSSSDGTKAHAIAATGEIQGLNSGVVNITYTIISGCYRDTAFKVIEPLTASVTITDSPYSLTPLCAGTLVTYRAHPVNGGNASYIWQLFGHDILGATDSVYTYNPIHGDYIGLYMIAHNICSAPVPAFDTITMNMYPQSAPTVVIMTTTTNPEIQYLGQIVDMYANVTFGGSFPQYQWYLNGAAIPGATLSHYAARVYGDATFYLKVKGDSPCPTDSLGVSNSIFFTTHALGVGSLTANSNLSLFPNPNTGSFTLSGTLGTASNNEVYIEVTDVLGHVIYKGTTMAQNGAVKAQVMLDNQTAPGAYQLRVNSETENQVFHFVIGE